MAVLPCWLDDAIGGDTHTAPGVRHSGDAAIGGGETTAAFVYLRQRTVWYRKAGVLYTDTVAGRVPPLVWGGTPETSVVGTVDRTLDDYHVFTVAVFGGPATLYICGQALWTGIGEDYDVCGLEVVRQFEWTRYQPRGPRCISFVRPDLDPIVRLLAGNGGSGYSGDGGDPKLAAVDYPSSVIRYQGDYYIGQQGAVRKVTADGTRITTVVGSGTPGHNGDGSALGTQLRVVTGVAFDASGKMWLIDQDDTIGGHDPMGLQYLFYEDINPTQNFSNQYWLYRNYDPGGMDGVDPLPSLYTGTLLDNDGDHMDADLAINPDAYDCIRVVDLAGDTVTSQHHVVTFPRPLFVEPPITPDPYPFQISLASSLAIGPDGTVYIADGYDLGLFSLSSHPAAGHMYIATVNPSTAEVGKVVWKRWFYPPTPVPPLGLEGNGPFWDSNYFSPTSFPQQLWITSDRSLYWADSRTNNVWRRKADGTFVHVFGSRLGVSGRQLLECPWGCCVDGRGNVYISDRHAHVVWRVRPDGQSRIVLGQAHNPGNTPEGSPGTETLIRNPGQLFVTPCGQLVVCDTGNNRVLALGCAC